MDVHAEIERLADPYLDGTLPEDEDREVEAHLSTCAECAARFEPPTAEAPEPFWRSAGFARASKLFLAACIGIALILLGAIFRGDALPTSAAEAVDDAAIMVPAQRRQASVDVPYMNNSLVAEEDMPARVFRVSGGGGGGGGRVTAPENPFLADPKLIRHAELQLEADSFATAQARAGAIVAEEKGFVAGAEVQRLPNGKSSGTLTLRVPPERFDAVLERLRDLGAVRHQNVQTRDVTKTYLDLSARLGSKEVLVERLKKILAEAKGGVKDLLEVEVQIGKTVEEIEALKGELKYYDNVIGFSTIVLRLSERDLGQPAEIVETLQASLGIAVRETETAYAQAQKILLDAGGQVAEAELARGEILLATVRGRVEAAKYPDVRRALQALGHVTKDTAHRRRSAQGGPATAAAIPVRSEWAAVEVLLSTPSALVTRRTEVALETADVEAAYAAARRALEEAGAGKLEGGLNAGGESSSATLGGEVDVERLSRLLPNLAALGKLKRSETRHTLPPAGSAPAPERARLDLTIASPPPLVTEEHGMLRTLRSTIAGSVAALMWSLERLFVGLFLALPWAAIAFLAWLLWRRFHRKQALPA